ncbi:MCE family protein [Nocardia farcinica]|uniref:Virulence factor Mce family protein n=1 Tax=Nocardia farcinica TaxID=37329 RepID=A0A449H410_NOCFR|nr:MULTISPECIES: MCE family protein [Nocardia]MBF6071995.1 MCE family protein [Nocardia farcinica]MBF6141556.1 MCE family protein [Nocardia farcinica]MBF6188720.1 MCE family protein [Nocardia farcinica]MBF6234408.1 MCE family protein [Nocardia farcinica]MBF6259155.1 MCE family protein [Nocardia farcinica]
MNIPLWNYLVRRRVAIANLGLVAVLLAGSAYLGLAVLRINPLPDTYTVTVELRNSGGLLANNDVTFRGSRVGRVAEVRVAEVGIVAEAEIQSWAKIPVGGTVAVGRLSAAGEQYLDFRPDADSGPYLRDGDVVEVARTTTPVTVPSVLDNMSGLIGGMNPARLNVIIDELDKALAGGPDRLRNMISGISRAMAGLDELLPQTRQLIENLEIIADTTSHAQPDLTTLTTGAGALFEQLTAADQELRRFLDLAPGQLATVGGFIADTEDPITNLTTNFVAITRAAKLRQPAIEALFPALRAGSAAIGVPAHDGAYHTLVDPWPRPTCDYPTVPKIPVVAATDSRVRLYNYCVTDDPALQIRGSANAPRPNVPDNGSGPPPGVTGDEMSQPAPTPR